MSHIKWFAINVDKKYQVRNNTRCFHVVMFTVISVIKNHVIDVSLIDFIRLNFYS